MAGRNSALAAAAISAIARQSVVTFEEYSNAQYAEAQKKRENPDTYTSNIFFKGGLSVDALHQSHLQGGQVHTEVYAEDFEALPTVGLDDYGADTTEDDFDELSGLPTGNTDPTKKHLIYVKTLTGQTLSIYPKLTDTLEKVKELINRKASIPVDQQRLILSGKQLDDNHSLSDYSVQEESTLHLILRTRAAFSGKILSFVGSDHLDSDYDFDFTNVRDEDRVFMRGNLVYRRPCGWNRMALKVLNKYGNDNRWLGDATRNFRHGSNNEEWPVSYHGTGKHDCNSIADDGYELSKGKRLLFGRGVYTTPDINTAKLYAEKFEFQNTKYYVVVQNRVNPATLARIRSQENDDTGIGEYWVSPNSSDIRPYGICVMRVRDEDEDDDDDEEGDDDEDEDDDDMN